VYLVNLPPLARMALSPRIMATLGDSVGEFRRDPDFSFFRLARALLNAVKGEKIVRHGKRYVLNSFLPPFPSPAYARLLRASRDPGMPFRSQALARRTSPLSVFLAVTSACELSCPHCSAKLRSGGSGGELSTAEWASIAREFSDMGTAIVGFTGGEPLLRKDLEDLVASVKGKSETIVYTSGLGLGEERARSLAGSGLYACGVSLDFPDAGRHDANRGRSGSHAAALAALGAARSAGLYAFAQTVVRRELLGDGLERVFRVAKEAGAHELRVLEPIPAGRLLGAEGELLGEAEREAIRRFQYSKNRKPGLPRVSAFAHTESASQFGCGAGTQHSYVSPRGDLYPCDFLPLAFANLRSGGVREAWLRMTDAIGAPKGSCFAMELKGLLASRAAELPLGEEASAEICACRRAKSYPRFYELLQGRRMAGSAGEAGPEPDEA